MTWAKQNGLEFSVLPIFGVPACITVVHYAIIQSRQEMGSKAWMPSSAALEALARYSITLW